jgi:hypothetical protein
MYINFFGNSLQIQREKYLGGSKGGCQERVGGGSVGWVMRVDVILSAMLCYAVQLLPSAA